METCVFNIQPYSIHDGPGIRTTVFVKGCPLKCLWCQNPESQAFDPQLMFYQSRCKSCGACAAVCPHGAVTMKDGKPATDHSVCVNCGVCVEACQAEAREITGRMRSVEEVMKKILEDKLFLTGSGGGVTISGGEPLSHPEFTLALLKACHAEGLHTAIDTTGFASWEVAEPIFRETDLVLYDLKHMDNEGHLKCTAVPNGPILENAKKLAKLDTEVWVRVPVIPELNGSKENIAATAKFVAEEMDAKPVVYLLPYHKMGQAKAESLETGMPMLDATVPSDDYMQELGAIVESYGVRVHIGG